MKKIFSIILCTLFITGFSLTAGAQTDEFKAARNLEIQYNILRQLQANYVDTLDAGKLVKTGIDAMLHSIDPYTVYIDEADQENLQLMTTATYGGIGATIKKVDSLGVIIAQPYEGSPAAENGLEPGDIILKIDGKDVKPLTAEQCSSRMKGQPGTKVEFLIRKARSGKTVKQVITRRRVHFPDVVYSGITGGNIGYIDLSAFTVGGSRDVRDAVVKLKNEGAEGIILDLRGNGGGLLDEAVKIVSLFVPKGTLVVTSRGRIPGSIRYYKTDTEPLDTEIPLAVLVNSGTASSSEIVSGSLQDLDRATIIGTRTFGKGLVQSIVPVGYGGKLKVTTAKYYTPSGRCVQAIDYSHRNPDGSVGSIPDSLKKPFKTMHGRTVYDGGGITPDTLIPSVKYSRPTMSLLYNDIFGDYARKFYAEHDSISLPENFAMTEKEYSDFVEYASARKFDSRSAAQVALDDIIKDAKDENMYDLNKQEFEALSKKLNISKTQMLRIKEKEFKPVLESEIVRAYYYNAGSAEFILRYDKQFAKALKCFREVIAKRNPDKPLE